MKFIYESRACWNEVIKFWERSGPYSGYCGGMGNALLLLLNYFINFVY